VYYKAWKGELPSEEELELTKGVILTGSGYSVFGKSRPLWVEPVKELVRNIHNNKKQIKLVGICFGHQLIAQALGGRVRRMNIDRPIIIENQRIHLTDNFYKFNKAAEIFQEKKNLYVMESHRDEVVRLPAEAELTAWSPTTNVEGFKIGHNVMCFQFHPEYSREFVKFRLRTEGNPYARKGKNGLKHQERTINSLKYPSNRMLIF